MNCSVSLDLKAYAQTVRYEKARNGLEASYFIILYRTIYSEERTKERVRMETYFFELSNFALLTLSVTCSLIAIHRHFCFHGKIELISINHRFDGTPNVFVLIWRNYTRDSNDLSDENL